MVDRQAAHARRQVGEAAVASATARATAARVAGRRQYYGAGRVQRSGGVTAPELEEGKEAARRGGSRSKIGGAVVASGRATPQRAHSASDRPTSQWLRPQPGQGRGSPVIWSGRGPAA
jgi:hypothetical protein